MSTKINIKKLDDSEVEITGEISAEAFESFRDRAIKDIATSVKLDGFRQGFAPEKALIERVGEMPILEAMAEFALQKFYPEILAENKIESIGHPEISIVKIARNNPLGFKIKTAVMPEVELPDYEKIIKKIEKVDESKIKADEKEVEKAIESLKKMKAGSAHVHGEHCDHDHDADKETEDTKNTEDTKSTKNTKDTKEEVLPELDDEFAKALGLENVEALKKAIETDILADAKHRASQKRSLQIIEDTTKAMKVKLPKVLVESEKDKMILEIKNNLLRSGFEWEKYLEKTKKTEEEIRNELEEDAVKRVKFALLLEKIATKEKIEIPEKELNEEMEKLIAYYKGQNQNIDKARLRNYTSNALKSERVVKLLESL